MTTMAALLSGLPLMLEGGAGSELRQPLGYAMVGGLLLSQIPLSTRRPSSIFTSIVCSTGLRRDNTSGCLTSRNNCASGSRVVQGENAVISLKPFVRSSGSSRPVRWRRSRAS